MSQPANTPSPALPVRGHPYLVSLEVFEGPLDLLLHLIEKDELDITKVSLAKVTDGYLDYIRRAENINAANLADFLVVAAKLLLIKSRALLPAPPSVTALEPEEDVGDELARQLLEYKKFKELAQQLREREDQGLRAYLRIVSTPAVERRLDMSGVSLEDLLTAARQALAVTPPAEEANGVLAPLTISISDKIDEIQTILRRKASFSFDRILRRSKSRAEVVITFLALLELFRSGLVRVEQAKLFGEILVLRPEEPVPASEQPQAG